MKRSVVLLILLSYCDAVWADGPADEPVETAPWGKIVRDDQRQIIQLQIDGGSASGDIELPALSANMTSAYWQDGLRRRALAVELNRATGRWNVDLPKSVAAAKTATVILETADDSRQLPDGRLIFSALDATIHGAGAKLETEPGNHRIGFWTNRDDFVDWQYTASRYGMYDVELTYSLAGGRGSTIEVELAGRRLTGEIEPTHSWYRYRTVALGKIYVQQTGRQTLTVKCVEKTGPACMNLKAVTMRPAAEGGPIRQADDGVVTCHARDVTVHGVKARYEPKPIKNTVGYWAVQSDWISWDFTLDRPGRYTVEILQGCGKGQGGSRVELSVDDQPLRFVVEDTGHFQNFIPRHIGAVTISAAGEHRISVRPIHKAAKAVMDLRQVRLLPAEPVK